MEFGVFDTNPPQQRVSSLQPLPAVDAGSFSVVVIAGKHVCMFKSTGPMLMKLSVTVISYTFSLIFWGHREEGLGIRLQGYVMSE